MNWKTLLCEKRRRGFSTTSVSTDPRNEFQRDYHRIIGSASFRRLQDKTQVFPLDRGDFVRTRLTHSLEVSSFAKSLGQMIFRSLVRYKKDEELSWQDIEKICSVLECAGLVHDIGNPPFGHFGEDYIRDWFRRNIPQLELGGKRIEDMLSDQMLNDLYNFEGNAQALRLLTKLHFLVDENGMNLTYTLLNTIIKYPVPSTGINKHSGNIKDKKMGYYYADTEIYKDITENTGAVDCRHPLAFILEAADDIAYKTADIEDAVKKGFITLPQLLAELKKNTDKCADKGELEEYSKAAAKLEEYYANALEKGISSPEQNAVQRWIIYVQGVLLRCAAFGFTDNYDAIMAGTFPRELLAVSRGNVLAGVLGEIAYNYVFRSKEIYKLEIAAGEIYEFLLNKLTRAALVYDTEYSGSAIEQRIMRLVSENYIRAYKFAAEGKSEEEKLYLRLMLVTDYVCGMTDGYAQKLYRELSGIE
ncbi:deoxyguanosinetriphosphate triphosphohydrolase [Ruminococcus flavefaciens]|uniref:HD domain-containing protein n=1 Tax=Ruminococcus flavefaciens 007c TaxID=1341157 RepID=W7V0I7_RUMFL|nr:deoxyguanosinetriphosphate triphosphohydrolase [Ruminococcus flavefaciens]EWM54272.1 hypothetical protein RF007C_11725 [Ruminococcus flavefaciens 007c]